MKKTITLLTLSAIFLISCGKEKQEVAANEPAILVKVVATLPIPTVILCPPAEKSKPRTVRMSVQE